MVRTRNAYAVREAVRNAVDGDNGFLPNADNEGRYYMINGSTFTIVEPEPWDEPVDGALLLNDLAATFRRFVVLPSEHMVTIVALWTLHTYAFLLGVITPILAIYSPDKSCGKTTLRDLRVIFSAKAGFGMNVIQARFVVLHPVQLRRTTSVVQFYAIDINGFVFIASFALGDAWLAPMADVAAAPVSRAQPR